MSINAKWYNSMLFTNVEDMLMHFALVYVVDAPFILSKK